jgi:2-polyprenyl-6-methoxyphenol hydroxylase-like FAD-dependent oxidoreductase
LLDTFGVPSGEPPPEGYIARRHFSMTAGQLRIGIVGAGIGGLTLALALRQRGLTADVYEQASELREIGAAVSLTANGSRELERLGCLDAIAALSAEPTEFVWRGWRDDRRVAAFPVAHGGAYQSRFGAPFCNIHLPTSSVCWEAPTDPIACT